MLGGFALSVDGQAVAGGSWRLRKARTLVKLLALAPGHRLHREQAIEVLWPDRPPDAAANNLHQALHVARRRLGGGEPRPLRLADDAIVLGDVWIDVDAFRTQAGEALRAGEPARARAALALYRGPLLPEDLYEEWTEPHRAELERLRERLVALSGGDAPLQRERRDNLPVELTTFVGRETELTEVTRLLARGPLVTLAGPAGAGKTRLATEAAARARERFRDGVWLVELAPLSQPELLADAIAVALGLTRGGRSPDLAAIVERLADRELLIVLDNCEHLVAGCASAVEPLLRGCPGVQVLATSREPLAVAGELVWRVPSLSLPPARHGRPPADLLRYESVRLFVERARSVQPRFTPTAENAAAVVEICNRLDGMPLAIELAAARAGSLPPAEIARRLRESFRLLRQERAVDRQQTLKAALDWSYRLLDPPAARLLARLAVFAGAFGLDAAERVCGDEGVPRDEVLDLLLQLVDKSLVTAVEDAGGARYRLLEMIRQYARERLVESGELAAVAERHARWYAALGQGSAAEQDTATGRRSRLRRLDRDHADLRSALSWLLDHDPPNALQMTTALDDWWLLRGRLREGHDWLMRAVASTPPSTPAAAGALLRAVPFAVRGGDMDAGDQLTGRSLEIASALGDHAAAAAALHMRGLHDWLRGRFDEARATLESAVAAGRQASRPGPEANATHGLAIVEIASRRLDRARALLERTLALLAQAGHDPAHDFLVSSIGLVPVLDGNGRVLRVVEEESQVTFRRVAAGPAHAYTHATLALVARLDGRFDGAELLLRDALVELRAADDDAGIAQLLAARGRLATLRGDLDGAHQALGESLAIRQRLGDVRSVTIGLNLLAELAAAAGDHAERRALLARALAMLQEVGDRPALTWSLLALAEAELATGHPDRARGALEAGMATAERLGSQLLRGWMLIALAEAERAGGAPNLAPALLEEARDAFARADDPWGLERAETLIGDAK